MRYSRNEPGTPRLDGRMNANDPKSRGREARRARLLDLMDRRGLGGVVLRRPANFAWYTGGADSRVDRSVRDGVADILITPAREAVVTSAIEAERMRNEQTPELPVHEYPWPEGPAGLLRELSDGAPLGFDVAVEGAALIDDEVAALRRVLDPDAVERLLAIGADATAAVAEAAEAIEPGVDELDAAAALAAACRRRALTAPVLLVGGDERIELYRHAIPHGGPIERRAMLVVSAERGGLFANLTRFVELEERSPELERRVAACDEILRRMREEATRPGRTLAEALADCTRFYAEAGFPGEWRRHHQGGTTGYGSREVIATPHTHDPIVVGNAFAWNPSITGFKAEETFVLTAEGPRVVTGALATAT
jgi:Xaa-Pro dipeptidase